MNRVLLFLRKYSGIFCLILLMWGGNVFGQTEVTYSSFTSITCPATPVATITGAPVGLTFSQISRGVGVNCGVAGGSISGSTFENNLTTNLAASKWYTFTITSNAATSFTLNSLNIVSRVSNTGGSPNVSVQYNIDGGSRNPIGSFVPTGSSTTYTITPSSAIAVGSGQVLNIFIIPNSLNASTTTCRVENNTSVNVTATPAGKISVASGDWNTDATWSPTGVPTASDNVTITAGHTVHTTTSLTRTASTTVNGTFELRNGGDVDDTSTGVFIYHNTTGTLNFNTTTTIYEVTDTDKFWPTTAGPININVINSGTTGTTGGMRLNNSTKTVTGNLTVSGFNDTNLAGVYLNSSELNLNALCQINFSGFFANPPTYGSASTLIYNTGGAFNRGSEWTTATSGAGYPANVQVARPGLTNTIVNMGTATAQCSGSVTIDANTQLNVTTGNLTVLQNVTTNGTIFLGGDISLNGNWTVGAAGSQLNNGKAVFFRGLSGNQTITKTSAGTVFFDFLVVDKVAGNVVFSSSPATSVEINTATAGAGVVQLLNGGNLDLNGQSLTLNNANGNIFVNGARTITSSATGANLIINGAKYVTQSGTLNIGANVNTILNAGFDFGINKTTINGVLRLNNGGFALNATAPIYAIGSTLVFNSGDFYDMHNGTVDVAGWFRNVASTGIAQGGIPWNVQISANTAVRYNTSNNDVFPRYINGNLTIDSGSSFTLGGISGTAGDFFLRGNWINNGIFDPNNRLVSFNGATAQSITGATTFDYLLINKSGNTVNLLANIVVNRDLILTNNNIVLGAFNLTFPNKASIITANANSYITASGTGQIIRQGIDGTADWIFPVGVANSGRYAPITLKNMPGTRQIGVRVTEAFSPLTAVPSQTLKTQWIISSDMLTSPVTIATGWQSADLGSSMSFTPPALGEIGIASGTLPYALYDASLNSNSTEVNTLSLGAGNNAVVVGLKNAIKLANDDCANAISLTVNSGTSCTVTTPGNLLSASQSIAPVNCASNTSSTALDIWYKFTATSVSHIISVTPTSPFDAVFDVRSGGCNGTTIGCADAFASNTNTEKVTLNTLTVGVEYYVRVYEYNGSAASSKPFTICVSAGPIPTITLVGTPSLFTYAQGQGPSVRQTVVVSGANLASDITINAPNLNWEISTTSTFDTPTLPNTSSSIILTKTVSNTVGNNNIHIRLKAGLVQGQYDFSTDNDLIVSSFNAITKNADLDGEVTAPVAVINVEGNIGSFPDITPVTNTPLGTDNTLFGQQTIGNVQTKSFRIQNLGGLPLTVSNITISGANNVDFSVTNPPTYPLIIAPNSMVTFEISFNPLAIGQRDAIISIANNSNNISPQFSFNIRGTGNNAEVDITGNSTLIPSGSTIISTADFTLIGSANGSATNPTTVSKNFIINNSGNVSLLIAGITIIGADSNQFSVSPTTATIAAGASRTITVTFAPTSFGVKNAVLSIGNNDVTDNENPYTFAVQGNGVNFVVCAPGEQIIYQTGFESSEGFVLNTFNSDPYYQDTNYSTGGATTKWITTYGTPTTSQPIISGGQSMQMRLYTNGVIGSTYTNFNLMDVKRVTFNARSQDGILSVEVSHSLNNGTSWILPEVFPLSNLVQSFVYNVNSSIGSNVRIKFTLVGVAPVNSGDNKKLVIDDVVVYKGFENIKIWDGNAWSGAGNTLAPTSSQKAIITGTYNSATNGGDIKACECEVTSTGVVTMNAGHTLNIQGVLNNAGIINILDSGSLVQHNDFTVNYGTIKMQRISQPMVRFDYTYWSSPMFANDNATVEEGEFTLLQLSSTTPVNRFYRWNPGATTASGWIAVQPSTTSMVPGKGYIVRAPIATSLSVPEAYDAAFIGKPNNGIVQAAVLGQADPDPIVPNTYYNWNLLGNPYPSAVSADAFLDANSGSTSGNDVLGGTLYFWTHNTSPTSGSYSANDYASYNGTGATATNPGANAAAPSGYIAAGQGFFVKGVADGNAIFSNSMRTAALVGTSNNNNQFFRSAASVTDQNPTTAVKSRVWLNLFNGQQAFSQTLVGYVSNATNAYDVRYDGESFGGNKVTFYSVLGAKNLVIQGRALPFSNQDTVPLGYKTTLTGNVTISIDHVDGLMEDQDIYLEDTVLNVVHDLKAAPYTFATVPGTFNTRFVLRYVPQENLSNPTFDQQVQAVRIYKNSADLFVHSPYETIATVSVYDLTGRLLFERKNCNTNRFETNGISVNQQALIVKVTLVNGGVVVEKVL